MIGFIVFGLVVGALARLIKPGRQNLSILATLLLGLVGSVIGGLVANLLGTGGIFELNVLGSLVANLLGTGGIFELNVLGSLVAIVAAVLLIGVAEGITGRRAVRN